jgi:DNA-directed RNA polymerase specialized sigma subunit
MINTYDTEMKDHTRERDKVSADYHESHHELQQISEEYKQRLEERKKREEILALMKKKNAE